MPRIRKAWHVRPTWSDDPIGDLVYAETAGKARYKSWLDALDVFPEMRITELEVRRAKHLDAVLPDEHRLVADLTAEQRHMVAHAFGRDRRGNGYREHFCTAPGDMNALRLAWEFGIFSGPHGEREYGNTPGWSGAFFYLTELGKEVARSMLPTYAT